MPSFTDLKTLKKYLQMQVNLAMSDDVSERSKNELKKKINTKVYRRPKGSYERTFELRESVIAETRSNRNLTTTTILNDTDEMGYNADMAEKGQHASWVTKKDTAFWIPYWIDQGNEHEGTPLHVHKPTNYFKHTIDSLHKNKYHIIALRNGLNSRGVTAEYKK